MCSLAFTIQPLLHPRMASHQSHYHLLPEHPEKAATTNTSFNPPSILNIKPNPTNQSCNKHLCGLYDNEHLVIGQHVRFPTSWDKPYGSNIRSQVLIGVIPSLTTLLAHLNTPCTATPSLAPVDNRTKPSSPPTQQPGAYPAAGVESAPARDIQSWTQQLMRVAQRWCLSPERAGAMRGRRSGGRRGNEGGGD